MSWLRCWSVRNVLDLYVDGRLTEAAAARVASHLKTCSACRAEEAELRPVPAGKKLQAPEGLAESILEKLAEGSAPKEPAPPLWEGLRLSPAQAAALVYIAVLAGGHALPGVYSQAHAAAPAKTEAPR